MSLRSRRRPELFSTERDRILGSVRAARNAVLAGHRSLKADGAHYRAGTALTQAMDAYGEAITGKPGFFLDCGGSHLNTGWAKQPDK